LSAEDTLSGAVERIVFRSPESGYTVLRLRAEAGGATSTVVGVLPEIRPGEILRARGAWRDDRTWGRQFAAAAVDILPPTTIEGIESYLGSGLIEGLGHGLAKRLARAFGTETARVIEEEPLRLREVPGIGTKLAQRIVDAWRDERGVRDILLFLQSHGVGLGRARRILATYGAGAVSRVTADPYALARDVHGIGFHTADALAKRLGTASDATIRLVAALEHAVREAAEEGHSAMPEALAIGAAARLLGMEETPLRPALDQALEEGSLVLTETAAGPLVQLPHLAEAEIAIAEDVGRLLAGRPVWPPADPETALARAEERLGVALAPSQIEAVLQALRSKLLIITGGPGTGKTTLVRAILAALPEEGIEVALAAPTGRAAKRLAESTGREARTLHRLLEADPARGFRRGRGRQLGAELVIVDEVSMVDLLLMQALLQALPESAALVLVGDVDQLPSVGPGLVLADLIASDLVPVVRLTEIFRQAAESAIVRNAHRINRGEPPQFGREGDGSEDFFGVRASGPEDALAKVVELVAERIPQRFGLDPVAEIQVLCPTHRGTVGTRELNRAPQASLNPEPAAQLERGGNRLGVGDKVMQLENDYDRDVYNGDIGRVAAVDAAARSLRVTIDGRAVDYAAADLGMLSMAYAVTVHKAQGSEYPAVVLVLLRQHGRMLRRRLLYTAISRARRLAVIVAEPDALERAVQDVGEQRRLTLLKQRLIQLGIR
jgi:exodeoxyribonuclease V alpha subunit